MQTQVLLTIRYNAVTTYLFIYLFIYTPISLFVHFVRYLFFTHPHIYLSVYLSIQIIDPSIYLFTCPFVHSFTVLSIYSFTYLLNFIWLFLFLHGQVGLSTILLPSSRVYMMKSAYLFQ